jgi:uncharacterized caspase-like protein
MNEAIPKNTLAASDIFALVIGIGSYQDSRIPPLKHACDDAGAFADMLRKQPGLGLPPQNVKVLLDAEATNLEVRDALTGWLFNKTTPDSTVLLFFAGHGDVEQDRSRRRDFCEYLLLWDSRPDNLYASALSNEEFERCLCTIRARRLVVFMDACYSGGVARAGARDVRTLHDPRRWTFGGEGRVIITAAKASQQSWEDASYGHGIFTHHLLEGLRGKADSNKDGRVSITELYGHLERTVPESVWRLKHAVQEPFFSGELGSDITFIIDAQRVSELAARAQEEDRLRAAELLARQQRLLELYNQHQLPWRQFRRSMELLEKPLEQLSADEQDLSDLLHLLLESKISAERYLRIADRVPERERLPEHDAPPPVHLGAQPPPQRTLATMREWIDSLREGQDRTQDRRNGSTHSQAGLPAKPPPPQRMAFCIYCGKRLAPGLRFCTGCGRAVK